MMKHNAIIVAGTHSGCGKTTVTLGIMAALCQRKVTVQPFKCGPDFIDPTLHRLMTGQLSRNLDIRMCGGDYVEQLFASHAPTDGISIIEGVMGLFDGGNGSAARLATLLDIPVILVVDVRSAAESVAAVVKGFETLDPQVRVAGVIFNRVGSDRHLQLVRDAVDAHCRAAIIGALPRESSISLPSRHLGLHMGSEVQLNRQRLVALVEEHLDLDQLLVLAGSGQESENEESQAVQPTVYSKGREYVQDQTGENVRLGVAWDDAFCFYYQDNLDMLEQAGAELVIFSPIQDRDLPEDLDGLYFGGGYPELHGAALAANQTMRAQVLEFSQANKPVYGECGGFMYLTRAIIDTMGHQHPMAGVYPVAARMQKRLCRLGYRQIKTETDTLFGSSGTLAYGHEFHYSEIDPMPAEVERGYLLDDGRVEGYVMNNTLAGYVHLHWGRTPEVAEQFIRLMWDAAQTHS